VRWDPPVDDWDADEPDEPVNDEFEQKGCTGGLLAYFLPTQSEEMDRQKGRLADLGEQVALLKKEKKILVLQLRQEVRELILGSPPS
jgi:hypothetical protein